mmetsp:Transcript_16445/g.28185  ORF Transcript_16445/g.28185 Transcript_16445/m.28185 type:complete len:120 (+) Transcript_16445:76-435(+)|eukprot:CAMPEP_0119101182 /NCGR_PEP_ID=MMETSP1180-20130426/301_1 /TAXON_ID=3052 ORGANISM="Chlamydomonas cf sp, Strain CCMP681" /NCGR_SAMPLE_ID=MMETSP1180 /ASSEMBLY_ACC=CAM_ASM_000741 /LENGTH=119 /DNA_ID=CAMNT_0007085257 /DNA_START=75 /DNA_END=434 /DNA_ORIENTATION=-
MAPEPKEEELKEMSSEKAEIAIAQEAELDEPVRTRGERFVGWFRNIPNWDWSLIGIRVGLVCLLYGFLAGYFTALLEIAFAIRGTNYLSITESQLKRSSSPTWEQQPLFPWQIIQQNAS